MRILELLTGEELVAPELIGATKSEVLQELAQHLSAHYTEIDTGKLVEVLWERERLGSTAIGDGIAIPHGKLAGLRGVLGLFGRHRGGVDFESLDGNPTRLFFLLVAPEDSVGHHLKALARVSRLLKDAEFRRRLIEAPGSAELLELIRQEDEKL
jgi:PTS system nitrogen regulatory IIA component